MIRTARLSDIDRLIEIENSCFETDRLSRRSFRYFLTKGHSVTLVAEEEGVVQGYVLILFHQGTSMARLYSIAVDRSYRKSGIARQLVIAGEESAIEHECITMRLEIRVDNTPSICLFEGMGYHQFGRYLKYYEDESDAVRLEKRLIKNLPPNYTSVHYYQQTLDFTCGPACLMMAMKTLDDKIDMGRMMELRLWREATTIFMTSGLGGCGPWGLALAAHRRGFKVVIYAKQQDTFFIDSVRSEEKKEVIQLVEEDFLQEIAKEDITVNYQSVSAEEITEALDNGAVPVVLISSYRLYKEKFPHWVVITGHDDHFFYCHDPFIDEEKNRTVTDCVNMPIAQPEFERMSRYGKSGQRAAIILYPKDRSQ